MDGNAIHSLLTKVDTSPQYPLGMRSTQSAKGAGSITADKNVGDRTWIYVYNDSGVDLAEGHVCIRKAGETKYHVRKSPAAAASSARVVGVAQHAIVTGSYGWILREGLGEVIADTGGLTADVGLIIGNAVAGTADVPVAVTEEVFGWSTETVAATAKATCYLDCRG